MVAVAVLRRERYNVNQKKAHLKKKIGLIFNTVEKK